MAEKATFVLSDFDKTGRSEKDWSTGYVPTILLVEKGALVEKFSGNDFGKIVKFLG
jgi:hypothetical protein